VDYGAETEEFDYDLASNRTFHRTRAGLPHLYEIDAADQLSRIKNDTTGAILQRFDYDAAGRMTAVRTAAGTISEQLGYDALDRLQTYLRVADSYSLTLAYDASGNRRFRAAIAGGSSHYFAGGLERHGSVRVRRIPGDATMAEVHESQAVGLFRDGGGNVTAASTASAISLRRTYDAFGTLQSSSGTTPIERSFAGLTAEGQSPLLYAQARHYDPRFGRFLQRDPLGIGADQLYAYAANNPYRFHDPSGLSPQTINDPIAFFRSLLEGRGVAQTVAGLAAGGAGGVVFTAACMAIPGCAPAMAVVGVALLVRDGFNGFEGVLHFVESVRRVAVGEGTFGEAASVGFAVAGSLTAFAEAMSARLAANAVARGPGVMPRFSQKTAGVEFQPGGPFAGRTMGDVAAGLRDGTIKPSELPLEVIVRGETTLSMNTRSLVALRRAGVDPRQFVTRDLTGNAAAEAALTQRLMNNGLTNAGTDVIRITGSGVPRTSNIR
jgi:RHS repeat-associated protein